MHARLRFAVFALLSITASSGCGATQTPSDNGESGLRSLPESRALEVVREAAADSGVNVGEGFSADLAGGAIDVDFRLGTNFGVEWVSAQDRANDPTLPEPPTGGQLRIIAEPGGAQILILESASYRYDPRRARVQAGATSAADVEARLRRDLRDFFVYAGLTNG
ncbi:MAG: hypothetical protein ACI9KE_005156 [Polyangiales bacterium]|jgi:hypothetical protein